MSVSKLRILVAAIAIGVVLFPAAKAAHADSYQIFDLGTGYRRAPVAAPHGSITADGTVVIYASNMTCGYGIGCFQTMVNGVVVNQSPTNPGLVYDDGTPCTPTASPAFGGALTSGICNNGREIYGTTRFAPAPYASSIFDGSDPIAGLVASGFELDSVLLNSSGDFVFVANQGISAIDGDGEIYEAVDLTTDAAPEPGSIYLLGTGAVGLLWGMRRRWLPSR